MHPRVLIVDDEADIRESLRSVLEAFSTVDVEEAASGDEAQERLARGERFDVVITDERMPGLKGSDLLLWLRDQDPRAKRVLMSAYVEGFFGAKRAEVDLYVHKPFDTRTFVRDVEKLLEA